MYECAICNISHGKKRMLIYKNTNLETQQYAFLSKKKKKLFKALTVYTKKHNPGLLICSDCCELPDYVYQQ